MLRFGIIGIGTISHRFMKGIACSAKAEVIAVASRDEKKAQAYADQYGIAKAYGSYEALVQDSAVDAVYIATPQQVHYEHIMLCIAHHKHVLCEKPFVLTAKQAESIFDYARMQQVFVMEAQKAMFTPVLKQVKEWLDQGEIGKLRYAEGSFCYQKQFPDDHFMNDPLGGGSLYDVGVYPLTVLDYLIDTPLLESQGLAILNGHRVDELAQLILRYEPDILASIRSATAVQTANVLSLYGTDGWIAMPDFWKTTSCTICRGQEEQTLTIPFVSEFQFEIDHMVDCIHDQLLSSPIMSPQRTIQTMKLVEAWKQNWMRVCDENC